MILYKDNPSLDLKVVTTIKGDKEYRRNCRFIQGKYYLLERDCIKMDDGLWYRIDGGNIIFDYEKQEWLTKKQAGSRSMVRGVVSFDKNGPVLGHFSPNQFTNVDSRPPGLGKLKAINEEILIENGYFEDVATGLWYSKKEVTGSSMRQLQVIRNELRHTDRGYNIEDNEVDFHNKIEFHKTFKHQVSTKCREIARMLGDTTFGCEIEIAQGFLPYHLQCRHGVVICRDGSIDGGPELVTIPLQGAKGLSTLKSLSKALETRGSVNISCAFHVHLGNIPTDRLYISALFLLCYKLQDELFTMFPGYKTNPDGIKRKNYNQKLPRLGVHPLIDKSKEGVEQYVRDVCTKLFVFLGDDKVTPDMYNNRRVRKHPESRKWERHARYYWANLMNMFYSTRNTVEFRLHGPTTNFQKMVNWLLICNAIVRYAQFNAKTIISQSVTKKISVKEVLSYYKKHFDDETGSMLSDYLTAYFLSRKKAFEKDVAAGDMLSLWEISNDKEYSFSHKEVKELF
jgi:hypothetical protein